ncbi:MAG: dihydrolipoyllysine-residue acetyltransferase [Ignavibacteriaceae bacterium]|nr:dihydrolipoyllysine-residue acetyltransferase [Ignavibacteriaceae bacterium]
METDKATIEVPSEIEGTVAHVLVKEGDKAQVGQVVFTVEEGAAAKSAPAPQPQSAPVKEEVKVQETAPAPSAAAVTEPAGSSVYEEVLQTLGENIESATVVKVLVSTGDSVKEDQSIFEIETDKATIEVPSSKAGKVLEVLVKEGEKAKVGQIVLKLEVSGTAPAVKEAPASAPALKQEAPAPAPVYTQPVQPAQPAAAVFTTTEQILDEIKSPEVMYNPPKAFMDSQPPIAPNAAPAAPSVRRLARELGVNIGVIPGSGPGGRISIEDVKAYVKKLNESRAAAPAQVVVQSAAGATQIKPLPDFSKFGTVERKPMNNVRAKTAEHLSYAWSTIPHVTQFDKADITDIEEMRKQFSPVVQKSGGKLTMTGILVKVITQALKVFPQFNASVDMQKMELVYKNYYNIGIAVDTEHGLIVPNIKNADRLNLTQISAELAVISEKARNKKVSLEDIQGGCFSISNLGGIGGTYFTPIVNSPEVAILGVSKSQYEPVYKNGEFVPRLMLPLSLSYDHRIIDGADAIRFLRWIIEALENPFKLLIEG